VRTLESPLECRILCFIDWYYPAYKAGGPVRSVYNLCALLENKVDFTILCRQKDIDGTVVSHPSSQGIVGPFGENIYYRKIPSVALIKKWSDANPNGTWYINGIYSFRYSILPLIILKAMRLKNKVIVAPRGMLNPGALNIKSNKKKWFLSFATRLGLYHNVFWHATSSQELRCIQEQFQPSIEHTILSNIPVKPADNAGSSLKKKNSLKLYTVTRVVPIKQLEVIVRAVEQTGLYPISLDIIGPVEDEGYATILAALGEKIEGFDLRFLGPMAPEQIVAAQKQYDLFCLPSANENFGHAIYEAMACGNPVLISDQTPWKHLLSHSAGADIPTDNINQWTLFLSRFFHMEQAEHELWKKSALSFASVHYREKEWSEQYLNLLSHNTQI
jgi:glycosyltransferase involved in cell wall biosynthesis